jgi:uncharacterized protein YbaP (TraB family)
VHCPATVVAGVLSLLLGGCGAQTPAPRTPEPTEEPPADPVFLWRVSTTDGRPSYLFGTIHVGVSLDDALPAALRGALDGARIVIAEIDPEALTPQVLVEGTRLPSDTTLDALMPAPTFELLTHALAGQAPDQALRRLRPWVPMAMITRMRLAELAGGPLPPAMDLVVVSEARHRAIEVSFLETVEEQLAMMNALPEDTVVHFLRELLERPDVSRDVLRAMVDSYRAGDADRMAELVFRPEYMRDFPSFYDAVYFRRNGRWLPTLKAEIVRGGAFVAVGLGHLLGEHGLVALLRAEGFAVAGCRIPQGPPAAAMAADRAVTP